MHTTVSVSPSNSQSVSQQVSRWVSQSISMSVCQSVSQSVSQPVNQSVNYWISCISHNVDCMSDQTCSQFYISFPSMSIRGKIWYKNMIPCIKFSVLSIIQVKTHEEMNWVPNHSSNKIWNILASKFWILKNLEHVLGDQLILVYTKLLFDAMLISTNIFKFSDAELRPPFWVACFPFINKL